MSQMLGFTSHCGVTLHGMVHTKAELYYNPSVIYVRVTKVVADHESEFSG